MAIHRELIRKDLRIFFSDRRGMIISIIVPIALASLMATLYGGMQSKSGDKPKPVSIAVVDQDQSTLSKAFIEDLNKQGMVSVNEMPAADARSAIGGGKLP